MQCASEGSSSLGCTEDRPLAPTPFVIDQCRAWEEAGGTTLRQYLRWVEGQSAEGSRVIETVLPESDDDAVRILTIRRKGSRIPDCGDVGAYDRNALALTRCAGPLSEH